MTSAPLQRNVTTFLAAVLCACSPAPSEGVGPTTTGESTTGTTTGTALPTDTGSGTSETSTTTTPSIEVHFTAFVAWDPALGEITSPVIDNNPNFVSAYTATLRQPDWVEGNDDAECEIVLILDTLPASVDAVAEGFVWGLDIPIALPGTEDCTEKGFDIPIDPWFDYDWQLRLGGPLTADLEDWLVANEPSTGFDIEHYIGADWWSDTAQFTADADDNYWYGFAMDGQHVVDFDTPLTRADMVAPGGDLQRGYYVFKQTTAWPL